MVDAISRRCGASRNRAREAGRGDGGKAPQDRVRPWRVRRAARFVDRPFEARDVGQVGQFKGGRICRKGTDQLRPRR